MSAATRPKAAMRARATGEKDFMMDTLLIDDRKKGMKDDVQAGCFKGED
jgi:hypothetical protein